MAGRGPLLAALVAAAAAGPGPLVPSRIHVPGTDSPYATALAALRRDGAVVLSGLEPMGDGGLRATAGQLPGRLFTGEGPGVPELLSPGAPVNGVHEELREAKRRGLYLPGSGLLPHTDGYVYGDDLPDFVVLLCEQPASRGGGNVLLDGQTLLGSLEAGSEKERQLLAWLRATPVDLSEPADAGITAGRPASGPVVQHHNAASGVSRLKWRRQINVREAQRTSNWRPLAEGGAAAGEGQGGGYQSLWRPLAGAEGPAAEEAEGRLRELDALLQRSAADAFASHSFMLGPGEALVVDNYRVLHGRAPYAPGEGDGGSAGAEDPVRRLWRVWAWTSDGSGPPPDGARTSHPLNDEVFRDPAAGGEGEL